MGNGLRDLQGENTFLDEVILDDAGDRMFVCSDTDHCARQQNTEAAE